MNKYQQDNKEKIKERKRRYYLKNIGAYKERNKRYYKKNKEKIAIQSKIYYEKNKERKKAYYLVPENRKRKAEYKRTYKNNRMRYDHSFNTLNKLRERFRKAIKQYSQEGKIRSSRQYGISYKKIIKHLKPFPKEINKYHIDHIIPLKLFDLNDPEQIKKAFAPLNYQWLTKNQNLWKGHRLVDPSFKEVIK